MKRNIRCKCLILVILLAITTCWASSSQAGVSYSDPAGGWRYTYHADPFLAGVVDNDCISGVCPDGFGGTFSGDADFNNSNTVEGTDFLILQRGFGTTVVEPAVVPKESGNANNDQTVDGLDLATWEWQYGVNDVSEFDSEINALDGTFLHNQGDKWDGSAPGDPLSDPTVSASPAVSLTGRQGTSPGGAGVFSEGDVSYVRVQDAGNPEPHGWIQGLSDPALIPYPADSPDDPINTNRRVYFGHDMTQDVPEGESLDELVMTNTGITISFRMRIPDSGPLDDVYLEVDGDDPDTDPDVIPWFQDSPNGRGTPMTNGRGTINVAQNDPTNVDTQVGFSLVTSTDITGFCAENTGSLCTGTGSGGLIMNNLNGNAPSNNIDSESNGTLNILEISDDDLNEWNEFWITLENNGPIEGNIEVNVYMNGSTTPDTFQVTLASMNNAVYAGENNPFLDFGISDNAGFGSFDLDFLSYQIGVIAPTAAPASLGAAAVPEASSLILLASAAGITLARRRR